MLDIHNDAIEPETEEIESENELPEKPWDAKLIRVDQKVYSLHHLMEMIDNDSLDLTPDFQRLQVWEPHQKSRLIESIFLRIPIPTFYFSSDMDNNMQVVDGVQRLSAIHEFYQDRYKLARLEYLVDLHGKRYSDLKDEMWGRRFDGTQLQINVIDPQTPSEVKFDIFKRINTGGTPLTAQEIRHCLSTKQGRAFLANLASAQEFHDATHGVVRNHKRMADRELALRFCALKLWREGQIRYEDYHGSMDKFLDAVNESLGVSKQYDDSERARLKTLFVNAMANSLIVFDCYAFRKAENAQLNKALFDCVSVNIAEYDKDIVTRHAAELKDKIYKTIGDDASFIDAISQSTNSVRKVKYRFDKMEKILSETLE
ncbi:hypothetical protein AGMMS50276_06780 [Synergistales bacterium]|nr:hypothetical protein AGMMS50276_06780 [Synergistales bacterium]